MSLRFFLEEPDHVALWIGEPGERSGGNLDGSDECFAAECRCFIETGLDVFYFDVEDRVVPRLVAEHGHVTRNPQLAAGIDGRRRSGGLGLPAEKIAEEFLRFGKIPAADFKMYNWIAHRFGKNLLDNSRTKGEHGNVTGRRLIFFELLGRFRHYTGVMQCFIDTDTLEEFVLRRRPDLQAHVALRSRSTSLEV